MVSGSLMEAMRAFVIRAQQGEVDAFGGLVQATQRMAYAIAWNVLREPSSAQDAVQQAYLQAYRCLGSLKDPDAFSSWLRRIVITVALNMRRSQRTTFLRLDDVPDVPVLDESETRWSEAQRHRLAAALLTLSPEDRQLCDRRYHGQWSTARLAVRASVDETTMRKRLQRIREKLRKEIEMAEQIGVPPEEFGSDFPDKVIDLLARPRLTDLPENPVGETAELLRSAYADFAEAVLPEVVDMREVEQTSAADAVYVNPTELHRIDDHRILRYDLTLPLLLAVRYAGEPLRIWAAGKAYRAGQIDATHLDAFHQAEILWFDARANLDPWVATARVLQSLDRVLPGRAVRIAPTDYGMCSQAWELAVDEDGQWLEVLAWGVFTDRIVRHLGGDPRKHTAIGVGYGLERLAMLRHGIDDIRRVEAASVA